MIRPFRFNFPLLIIVGFISACSETPLVELVEVKRRTVEATVAGVSSGTVKAEQSAELAFGAVGRVNQINVQLGAIVHKGQILAEIENSDLRIALSRAEIELKRRNSVSSSAISASDLDTARLAVESARVALERTVIRAPYDGIITELHLELGQLSQITAVIPKAPIRITDLKPRYVLVDIDEVDLPRVKVGQIVRVRILAIRRESFPGIVRKVVPFVSSVREQDRTSEVEIDIESSGAAIPAGASADVEIVTDTRKDVLALPSRAVLGRSDKRYVYLIEAGKLRKKPVTVGLLNFDFTEVLSGISEADRVVKPSESVALSEGMKVRVKS